MSEAFLPAIEGQDAAREYFRRALEKRRLSHAYLLLGPPSAGKGRFALELAKSLFCREGKPCGSCATCRAVDHGNHPGVELFRAPEGKQVIDIDTVRELCERSHYRRDHVFVAILEDADRMTVPASNALLKTLEEPIGDFLLLLTAASTGSLLTTIVSRCHRVYLSAAAVGPDAAVDGAAWDEIAAPGFFARTDVRQWLSRVVPEADNGRVRVRSILDHALEVERESLTARSGNDGLDRRISRLDEILELRAGLDGNVSPDLVLERLLDLLVAPAR